MLKVGMSLDWLRWLCPANDHMAGLIFCPLISEERIEPPDLRSGDDPFPAVLTATLVAIVEIRSRPL